MKLHAQCISVVSAVAVGALTMGAPAAASAVPRPWTLTWLQGKASGNYTVVQQPLGIGRTYTVTGTVSAGGSADCYVVRFTAGAHSTDSPQACGSTPASFAFKYTVAVVNPATLRLCRVTVPGCGPALPLTGGIGV
ncbi:hypothetical protein [Actinoplanes sp. CA-252034]|uniref:hypothetical protein n=1 Tax=Actinoplanes sp. CA-252034 TaxID=3239906 RepID=UPI003D954629